MTVRRTAVTTPTRRVLVLMVSSSPRTPRSVAGATSSCGRQVLAAGMLRHRHRHRQWGYPEGLAWAVSGQVSVGCKVDLAPGFRRGFRGRRRTQEDRLITMSRRCHR